MFKGASTPGELNGFLDAGSHIEGDLNFEDTFRVDGRVTGRVRSKGDLVVGEGGVVDGEISVGRLLVSGTVKGRVQAAERVEVAAGGRILAEIQTRSLVIEDGALFDGQCSMGAAEASASDPRKSSENAPAAPSSEQDSERPPRIAVDAAKHSPGRPRG